MTTPTAPRLNLPELSLVALIGAAGAGKSTFAAQHFLPSEVLALDHFRQLVSGDPRCAEATADALESLLLVAGKRLARGLLTVIDAPLVRPEERRALVALARSHDVPPVAVVLDPPKSVLLSRQGSMAQGDRVQGDGLDTAAQSGLMDAQVMEMRRTLPGLPKEGFQEVWVLRDPVQAQAAQVRRVPLPGNRQDLSGPFDFIGDVHGCLPELRTLLDKLGYVLNGDQVTPPAGRTAVFVGDLVDRGPDSLGTLRLIMKMVSDGAALCVPGNHDEKLRRALEGKAVKALHGLDVTLAQLAQAGEDLKAQVRAFIDGLPSHLRLDGGRVVVAHAGLPERYHGRRSGRVRSFALYGDVDGSQDALGLPIRRDWAAEYRGQALVVYGHTPVAAPRQVNRTVNIDTGCAFGGHLSALRYPEMQVVSVPAQAQYAVPARPLAAPNQDQGRLDPLQFAQAGRIETRTFGGIQIKAAERLAALRAFGEGGLEAHWCVYLPPVLAPASSPEPLDAALAYYHGQGISQVLCQPHPAGQQVTLVLCRDEHTAIRRFGAGHSDTGHSVGRVYTRFARPALDAPAESALLTQVGQAVSAAGIWATLNTDWVVLDASLRPITAPLGPESGAVSVAVSGGGPGLTPLHLLASEHAVHLGQDQLWHTHMLGTLAQADPNLFRAAPVQVVTLGDPAQHAAALEWWANRPEDEALVIRPMNLGGQARPHVQPALLVGRSGGSARGLDAQRALALRQYHLGLEALHRWVDHAPPAAVQECVLGILALDSSAQIRSAQIRSAQTRS